MWFVVMQVLGNSRIGRRIVLLVLISVTLSIVTLTAGVMWFQLRDSVEDRKSSIEATAFVLASAIAEPVAAGNQRDAVNALRAIKRIPDVQLVVALNANGRQVASLGAASMLSADIVDANSGQFALLTRGWLPVTTDIVSSGKLVGRLIIVADVSDLRAQVARTLMLTLLFAVLAGGLGLAAALRLQRRITAPIASLIRAMTHIREARDYSTKVTHNADDETGLLVEAFNGMMTEIGYRDESLKRLAYFDPLTGIANRQEFQRRLSAVLEASLSEGSGAALFLIDLDDFKSVNDTFGHSAGDGLLMDVAAKFQGNCEAGTLLARLGGDEFAVIVEGVASVEAAQDAIAPLLAVLLKPVDIAGRQIAIGASAGVAFIPADGTSTVDLLRRADLALYSAKRNGRGSVHFYHPGLDEEMQLQALLAQDLRQALPGNQFEAYFQPQVDLRLQRVVGFETLLRWRHPKLGLVPPSKFIPIAESNGLIIDIGRWVIAESCRQGKEWLDQGHAFAHVSVNVSVAQMREAGFAQGIADALAESGLPPQHLCLELTESVFAGQPGLRVHAVLIALKALGVTLAIDDFGTGYSSLAYLLGLPFDTLKIDRAFVSGIASDESRRRLLRGIIELAHALGLSTVAEGAETHAEIDVLRAFGVDQVQGFIFGRPLPAKEAMEAALAAKAPPAESEGKTAA
jgi:diguanylate cyclase (GGDEF)-like protein